MTAYSLLSKRPDLAITVAYFSLSYFCPIFIAFDCLLDHSNELVTFCLLSVVGNVNAEHVDMKLHRKMHDDAFFMFL